jgi:hypothetical protein
MQENTRCNHRREKEGVSVLMLHRETLQAILKNMQKKNSILGTPFALSVRFRFVVLSSHEFFHMKVGGL